MLTEKTPLVLQDSPSAWKLLIKGPRDIWLLFALKFTSFTGYAVLFICVSLYMSQILHYSEQITGLIFSALGLALGLYFLIFSTLSYRYPLSRVLVFANCLGTIGYLLIVLVKNEYVQIGSMMSLVMMAVSINIPTTKLAVKKYTVKQSRSLGYSLYYIFLTLSGACSAVCIDVLLNKTNYSAEGFQLCFTMGLAMLGVSVVLSLFLRNFDLEDEEEETIGAVDFLKKVCSMKEFWKYLVVLVFAILIKCTNFHLGATLPLYMERTLADPHIGYVLALHSVVLLSGTVLLTGLVRYMSNYCLLIVGGLFMSFSPIVLMYGDGYAELCGFVTILAIGDSMFTPRLIEYSIEVSPRGFESLFLATASMPNSLSAVITGQASGILMWKFCHEDNEECGLVWGWVSSIGIFSTLCLLILKPLISKTS